MSLYEKMYVVVFNAITDALELLSDREGQVSELLKDAQQRSEEIYLEGKGA